MIFAYLLYKMAQARLIEGDGMLGLGVCALFEVLFELGIVLTAVMYAFGK